MSLKRKISYLILLPCFFVLLAAMAEIQWARQTFKDFIQNQSELFFEEEFKQKRQVQKGNKLHLDIVHQGLALQLQILLNFNLKLLNNDIKLNENFKSSSNSSLKMLEQKSMKLETNQKKIVDSQWYYQNITQEKDLSSINQDYLFQQGILEVISNNYLLTANDTIQNNQQLSNQYYLKFEQIFSGSSDSGLYYQSFANTNSSSSIPTFSANSTCSWNSKYYDSRCQEWYYQTMSNQGLFLGAPSLLSIDNDSKNYSIQMCGSVISASFEIKKIICGSIPMASLNKFMFHSNVGTDLVLTYHIQEQITTVYYKNNKTFNLLSQNDLKNENLSQSIEVLSTNFINNLLGSSKNYNFSGEDTIQTGQISSDAYLTITPVTIADKMFVQYQLANTFQNQACDRCNYFSKDTLITYNNTFLVIFKCLFSHFICNKKVLLINQVMQVVYKSDICSKFTNLITVFDQMLLFYAFATGIFSIIILGILYQYASLLSFRIELPVTKFLVLFQSISVENLIHDEFFEGCNESFIQRQYLTSLDMITLYDSFLSLFQTVRFSHFDYYQKNYGQSLLSWIKSLEFFTKQNDRRALGICFMNLGNIHFNCQRYSEALESFQMAIIQVNYELKMYSEHTSINSNEEDSFFERELHQIKFDRSYSYQKTLKRICLENKSIQLWDEYAKYLKKLKQSLHVYGNVPVRKIMLLLEQAQGQIQRQKLSSAKELINQAIQLKNQVSTFQNEKQKNLNFDSNHKLLRSYNSGSNKNIRKTQKMNTHSFKMIQGNSTPGSNQGKFSKRNFSNIFTSRKTTTPLPILEDSFQFFNLQSSNNIKGTQTKLTARNKGESQYLLSPSQQVTNFQFNKKKNMKDSQLSELGTSINKHQYLQNNEPSLPIVRISIEPRIDHTFRQLFESPKSSDHFLGTVLTPQSRNNSSIAFKSDGFSFQQKFDDKVEESYRFEENDFIFEDQKRENKRFSSYQSNEEIFHKNSFLFLQREQFGYEDLPIDIIKEILNLIKSKLLLQMYYLKKKRHMLDSYYQPDDNFVVDALDALTESLEECSCYIKFWRKQTIDLLGECLNLLGISSEQYLEINQTLTIQEQFEISCIIDVCDSALIAQVEEMVSLLMNKLINQDKDLISFLMITDIINVLVPKMQSKLLIDTFQENLKLSIKLLSTQYSKEYKQRPSLILAIINQIKYISVKSSLISKSNIKDTNLQKFNKFVLVITQFPLWSDITLHTYLLSLLEKNGIILLLLELQEKDCDSLPLCFSQENPFFKVFKDVSHLDSYLTNIRFATQAIGVPLIVEKFQTGCNAHFFLIQIINYYFIKQFFLTFKWISNLK